MKHRKSTDAVQANTAVADPATTDATFRGARYVDHEDGHYVRGVHNFYLECLFTVGQENLSKQPSATKSDRGASRIIPVILILSMRQGGRHSRGKKPASLRQTPLAGSPHPCGTKIIHVDMRSRKPLLVHQKIRPVREKASVTSLKGRHLNHRRRCSLLIETHPFIIDEDLVYESDTPV